jgi:hypothetical protein
MNIAKVLDSSAACCPHVVCDLQDKIEFLVAETIDGKLDLHDSFVFDEGV